MIKFKTVEHGIMTAVIYLFNGNPVIPMVNGMCDYRISVPDFCKK